MRIKKVKVTFLALMLCSFFSWSQAFAQEAYEFVNRDIHEILYALSLYTGISISADDTVSGKADFRCSGENFEEGFDAFLLQARLYVEKAENRWTVSRIHIQKNNGLYSLNAFDVTPLQLFEKVAIATGLCVTYDSLPTMKVSLHTDFCLAEELLRRITGLCMGFSLEKELEKAFHVSRVNSSQNHAAFSGKISFVENAGKWLVDVQNAPLSLAAEKIFNQAGKQFCFALGNEAKIMRACFKADSFDEALGLLCMQGGAEFKIHGDVYFLLPAKNKNSFADRGKTWRLCQLNFLKSSECVPMIAKRFPEIECMSSNESQRFLFLSDEEKALELKDFIAEIDCKNPSRLVKLQYIRTDDFLSHLPPFLDKASISDTGQGDSFFFIGSEAAYQRLLKELESIDRPVSRVRYDLLIMQYQSTRGSEWNPRLRTSRVHFGDINDGAVQLGNVLNLNLDVIGAFGLHFAGELQAAISESKAKVFADTTLNGVSGKPINFQNTNTYRYRDNNLDPETGEPIYSGVTKEIISGLKLEVTGTVTGDGMITSKITASVSRQGTDLSTTTGNPPPTSEKVITTEVRARSGEPVVLSGLVQEEDNENVSRTPIISKIPIIGNFFKGRETAGEKTELVIYLLPSAEIFGMEEKTSAEKKEDVKKRLLEIASKCVEVKNERKI
ncbi:type II secretion system protein GspD [Treponema sp.]|uniref:type II secretion system protein GspD n=1 Tax=Treponema sp. TaxID=166 RepID=UPI0025FC5227|nr:type II and III secretion system protein [Treponema sp.]MBR4323498.1 type II and III secretion system protein [Treponema sp.]